MRYREPYTVFKRTMKSGRVVWYYQTYDLEGHRTTARSTGQTSKSAARAYCLMLLKEEKLIPNTRGRLTFEEYCHNWWDWDKCEYVAYRKSRRTLSRSYVASSHAFMIRDLIPAFGKYRLKDITPHDVERWLQSFSQKGKTNQTANVTFSILKIMLGDAVRRGYLKTNPTASIKPLKRTGKEKGLIAPDIVQKILDKEAISKYWANRIYYILNLTAVSTGLRMGELQGLQTKHIADGCLLIEQQFNRKVNSLTDTKNHKSRRIPVSCELLNLLDELASDDPESFLFSLHPRKSRPMSPQPIRDSFYRALEIAGISRDEQKEQNITFHSWRHYFNTMMIRNNVPEQKIRMMTGHSSATMTEHYTHMDHTDLEEVKEIQNQIINFPKNSKVG